MLNITDILETITMIREENLDIRTVTMGISLFDCISDDPLRLEQKIYDKITGCAKNLVGVCCELERTYGIPIVNKRISVTPISYIGAGLSPDGFVRLAKTLDYAIENKYVPPQNFYGIGGMKIFRDLIWQMQGMMKADHKFYKSHGQYDFPQKKWPRMLAMYAVGAMIGNPKIKAKMGNKMNEGMLMPYKKLLDKTEKE